MRVIIIGSGIAGLSTAIGLRKVGIETALYERAPGLREVGAGISLWANALRALDYLGAGDAVRQRSLAMTTSEIRAHEGRKVQVAFSAADLLKQIGLSPVVAMIHRAELVGALAEFLPAGMARYGFECVGVEQSGNRALARFANGHTDEADAIIGADGIKSIVRASLFGAEPPRYSGYTCWRGISARPATIEPGYVGEWWGRGKRFGIATLPHDRVYWFAVCNAPADQPSTDHLAALREMFQGWADPVEELIAGTPPERIVHSDIIDRPPTKVWSRGRIAFLGDAAHATTPNLGQGGCMAIEDAVAVARALVKNSDDPTAAFEQFTAERYDRTAEIVNDSWQIGGIAHWEGYLACWLRDFLLGFALPLMGSGNIIKHASFDIGRLPERRA